MIKRDPIHFFDERGHAWVSRDHLAAEVKRLEEENAKLRRLLAAQVRARKASEDPPTITTH